MNDVLTMLQRAVDAHATDYAGYDPVTAGVLRAIVAGDPLLREAAADAAARAARKACQQAMAADLARVRELQQQAPGAPVWKDTGTMARAALFYRDDAEMAREVLFGEKDAARDAAAAV